MFRLLAAVAGICFQLVALSQPCNAQIVVGETNLLAPEATDAFGWEVALDGDRAVIGAKYGTGLQIQSGTAYVYQRDPIIGAWLLEAKLDAADGMTGDLFGTSVAISNNTILIGAKDDQDLGVKSGSAYLFARDPYTGVWSQKAKLLAPDGLTWDQFGNAVAIDGDTAVVSSLMDDTGAITDTGSVYVFVRDPLTRLWAPQAKLLALDPQFRHRFGIDVAISGDKVVVGAYWDEHNLLLKSGAAYIFERDPLTKLWAQTSKLIPNATLAYDYFGQSVDISGDRVAVGAPEADNLLLDSGSAFVFDRDPYTGLWNEQVRLSASDEYTMARFGVDVAVEGDNVVVGAKKRNVQGVREVGGAYLFARNPNTALWGETTILAPSDVIATKKYGCSVALSGNWLAVGSGNQHTVPRQWGNAYLESLLPGLSLSSNLAVYRAGDVMNITVTGLPAAQPVSGDLYISVVTPDGKRRYLNGKRQWSLAAVPMLRNYPIPAASYTLLQHTVTAADMLGDYQWQAWIADPVTSLPSSLIDSHATRIIP